MAKKAEEFHFTRKQIKEINKKIFGDPNNPDIKRYRQAGKYAMKGLRSEIVELWANEHEDAALSLNLATDVRSDIVKRNVNSGNEFGSVLITITSWINVGKYYRKSSAERWMHMDGHDTFGETKSGKEYVLDLQLYEGIIGLPGQSQQKDSPWRTDKNPDAINPAWNKYGEQRYHKEPLISFMEESHLWGEWSKRVEKGLKGLNK